MVKPNLRDAVLASLLAFSFVLSACSSVQQKASPSHGPDKLPPTDDLAAIENLNQKDMVKSGESISGMRRAALEEIAMSLGAQGALANRAKEINADVLKRGNTLDRVFNFRGLILDRNVLPPVLVQGDRTLSQSSPDVIRLSDKSYRIRRQARLVTTAPTWRDYLWMDYPPPAMPPASYMPKNDDEEKIWKAAIRRGWAQGTRQADAIFSENVGKLKSDYNGMVLYRNLLQQGLVTPPMVAKTELGVTGDNNAMNINDQILRITAKPAMQPKQAQSWRAVVIERGNGYRDEEDDLGKLSFSQ